MHISCLDVCLDVLLAYEGNVKSKGAWSGAHTPPISGPGALQTLVFIFQRSRVGVISVSAHSICVVTVRETGSIC